MVTSFSADLIQKQFSTDRTRQERAFTMPHATTLDGIRRLVRRTFAELGASLGEQMSEHILIRNDLYCGRRFRCGELQAVWFIEEDEIKVYGPDGAVHRVRPGMESSESNRSHLLRAA
jgi:hypothetical protein